MGSVIERIDQFRLKKGLKQREIADAMGVQQPQYGKMMRGENKVSAEHLGNLHAYFGKEIDLNWIITGQEDDDITLIIDNNEPENVDISKVSAESAEKLYDRVRSDKPEIALNYQQEIKFRSACRKTIAQNPDATIDELVIAGKVYLDHILRFPDLVIL